MARTNLFQSTHPHGVRRQKHQEITVFHYVSIHAPTRGATHPIQGDVEQTRFQSTHPHGVRLIVFFPISIMHLFQSTHPHGVRPITMFLVRSQRCFNPRTHTGCDWTGSDLAALAPKFQSTHPHGVRPPEQRFIERVFEFQSTHPHGVRPRWYTDDVTGQKFQSTHPHGVRLDGSVTISVVVSFNPRTHTGCDL